MTSPRTVVIGAGPAGLAATVELLRAGLTVTLVDAGARWGGQFWRHSADSLDADLHHDIGVYQSLAADLERFIANGSLTHLAQHHVWSVEVDDDETGTDSGGLVHAINHTGRPTNATLRWDYLVLAVGAYDRQLPFPGWDLPGVLTIGGAQALLKGNGVAVGPRVLIAGTGPFLLPVATALAARGSKVVGVHEANHPIGWRRHAATLARSRHLRKAAGYAAALLRYRVRLQHRSMVVAALRHRATRSGHRGPARPARQAARRHRAADSRRRAGHRLRLHRAGRTRHRRRLRDARHRRPRAYRHR